MSVDNLEGLEKALDVLSNPGLMRHSRKAEADIAASEADDLTRGEALALIKRQR